MAGSALNAAGLLINKVTHMELSDSQPTRSQPAFESPVRITYSLSASLPAVAAYTDIDLRLAEYKDACVDEFYMSCLQIRTEHIDVVHH